MSFKFETKIKIFFSFVLGIFLFFFCLPIVKAENGYQVTKVIDGDTVEIDN